MRLSDTTEPAQSLSADRNALGSLIERRSVENGSGDG